MIKKLLHTHNRFEFVAKAPMLLVAPLFGAEKERLWSPNWDPQFLWPSKPHDCEGMVFEISHGHKKVIWTNTLFNMETGWVQYVYTLPDVVITAIKITMKENEKSTHVSVEYSRTSLDPTANNLVKQMAKHDSNLGPVWEKQINEYLDKAY